MKLCNNTNIFQFNSRSICAQDSYLLLQALILAFRDKVNNVIQMRSLCLLCLFSTNGWKASQRLAR